MHRRKERCAGILGIHFAAPVVAGLDILPARCLRSSTRQRGRVWESPPTRLSSSTSASAVPTLCTIATRHSTSATAHSRPSVHPVHERAQPVHRIVPTVVRADLHAVNLRFHTSCWSISQPNLFDPPLSLPPLYRHLAACWTRPRLRTGRRVGAVPAAT